MIVWAGLIMSLPLVLEFAPSDQRFGHIHFGLRLCPTTYEIRKNEIADWLICIGKEGGVGKCTFKQGKLHRCRAYPKYLEHHWIKVESSFLVLVQPHHFPSHLLVPKFTGTSFRLQTTYLIKISIELNSPKTPFLTSTLSARNLKITFPGISRIPVQTHCRLYFHSLPHSLNRAYRALIFHHHISSDLSLPSSHRSKKQIPSQAKPAKNWGRRWLDFQFFKVCFFPLQ